MNIKPFLAVFMIIFAASPAAAYIGPGAGVGAIGTVIAVLGAIVLMIVGFVWYPIKRLLKRGKKPAEETSDQQ